MFPSTVGSRSPAAKDSCAIVPVGGRLMLWITSTVVGRQLEMQGNLWVKWEDGWSEKDGSEVLRQGEYWR